MQLLKMTGIRKAFSANVVLKGVDFSLERGEIRALLGENGAGKTTLMNILGGVLREDAGEIHIDGAAAKFFSPRDSINAGIAFIHQELNLVNDLPVYENIFLGREMMKCGLIDHAAMRQMAGDIFARMGIPLSPDALVGNLDASYKQIVEIAGALNMNARIIIMDEPTSSLTDVEIKRVFAIMRTLRDQGVSIVFISHKLNEVIDICDTYTVLRDGNVVAKGPVSDTSQARLAGHMVGHELITSRSETREYGEIMLKVEHLTLPGAFENVSFEMRAGQILGFTGLLGDGRSELFRAIFGVSPKYHGNISVDGQSVRMTDTTRAYKLGIGYVPRNRKENGIIPDMPILENGSIVTLKELTKLLFIDSREQKSTFDRQKNDLRIKMGASSDMITSLSGGNQQKVVLAKWLSAHPRVLIFDNPTQGVDVGAKEEIYGIIEQLATRGVAIAVLSSEAQEIARVCDAAYVMYHGRVQGRLEKDELTEERIMLLATDTNAKHFT